MKRFVLALPLTLAVLCFSALGQVATGGTFSLDQSVIAGGGGISTGGPFSLNGTAGQSAAGTHSTAAVFILDGGFWQSASLIPTAAEVTVGGRVLTNAGRSVPGATVIFTGPNGSVRIAVTNSFGFYRIDGLPAGQVYLVNVSARRFQFVTRVVMLLDDVAAFDLIML